MRKNLFAVLAASFWTVAAVLVAGCQPETRVVAPSAAPAKPNFKTEIQKNPNIPDSVKKSFGGH